MFRVPAPTGGNPAPSSEAAGHFLALLSGCFLGHNTCPPAADLPISLLFWNLPSTHPLVLCLCHRTPWVPTLKWAWAVSPHLCCRTRCGWFLIREALKEQHAHLKGHVLKARAMFVAGGSRWFLWREFPGPDAQSGLRMGGRAPRMHPVGSVGGCRGWDWGPVGRGTPARPQGVLHSWGQPRSCRLGRAWPPRVLVWMLRPWGPRRCGASPAPLLPAPGTRTPSVAH